MIVNQNNYNYSIQYIKLFEDAYKILSDSELVSDDDLGVGRNRPTAPFTCLEEYFMYLDILAKLHADNVQDFKNSDAETKNAAFATYSKFLMLPLDEEYFKINANSRTITVPPTFAKYGVSLNGDQRAETLLFEIDRYFDFMDLVRTNIYIQWTSPNDVNGESEITLVDYDDKKIRFGWPLSQNIIDVSGTLKFSVRCFIKNDAGTSLIYSFNTLPVAVSVKQALRATVGNPMYFDDDSINFFRDAIKAGANSGAEKFPESPIIFMNLPTTKQYLTNNTLTLDISANSVDQGNVTYHWKQEIDGTVTMLPTTGITISTEYVPTKDTNYVPKKHYYIHDADLSYSLVDPATTLFDKTAFLEKVSRCHIIDSTEPVCGKYYVEIINTVQNNNIKVLSATAIIPGPTSINYTKDLIETGSANILPVDGSGKILSITAVPDDSKATLSYVWYKKEAPDGVSSIIPNETERSLTVTEPGWYYVTTTNTLNRGEFTKNSATCRITNEPTAPVISGLTGETVQIVLSEGVEEIIVNASIENSAGLNNALISDGLTYTWYHRKNGQLELAENGQHGVVAINGNKLTVQFSGDDEVFMCTVTNALNGHTTSTNSDYYKVSDI